MKKLYTIAWMLMMSLVLSAAEISQEQALGNARSFMFQRSGDRLAKARAPQSMNMQAVPTGMPELYAFNIEGGGYVIASADDRTLPVLGYSLTGRFDANQMPDNMRAWLQGYAEQIRALGDAVVTSTTDSDPNMTAIEPLIKTHWRQKEPYNLQTPVTNGKHTLTGCVATAMAQVMYYHQWPKTATTTIPAYTYTDEVTLKPVDMEELPATTFEWDQMLPAYTDDNPGTEEQRQAVAKLMRYCGQAARMVYGETSGSETEYAVIALRHYFDYSKSARIAYRSDYSLSDWCRIIWEELNQKRPVFMDGRTEIIGHAFVVDGYDGSGMFHINWGMDEFKDDYFALDVMSAGDIDPDDMDPDDMDLDDPFQSIEKTQVPRYIHNQKIILGLEPSTGSEEVIPEITRYVKMSDFPDMYHNSFCAEFLYFDYEGKPANFESAIGTKDADGNVSIRAVDSDKRPILSGRTRLLSIQTGSLELPDGSYRLYPFYRDLDVADDSWHQIGNDHQYWGVNVNGSEMTFFFDPKLNIKAYLEGDEQAPLDECTLVVEVENEGDSEVKMPKSALLYGRPGNNKFGDVGMEEDGKREWELQPKEKITLRYPFTVPYQGDIELRLCRSSTGYPLATTTLTVDKEPHYYDIEVTDYKVVYKADEKDMTKAVECTLSLKSNDKRLFMGKIYARIGNDGRENGGYDTTPYSLLGFLPGQSDEVQAILESDLTAIQEPTELHLVVMIDYGDLDFIKLLDLVVKPGTIVTSKGTTTAISTIDAPDADAPFYDLQGRRVSHPHKGIYIQNGKKILRF